MGWLIAGVIAAGAAIIGGISSAVATSKASKAQEEAAETQAGQVREEYQWKVGDLKTQQARFRGNQKAVIGKAGVELSSGSPLALQAETSRMMAEDVRRLKQQGEWSAETLESEAEMYKKTRPWQVAGSLLGGVASGAGMFL